MPGIFLTLRCESSDCDFNCSLNDSVAIGVEQRLMKGVGWVRERGFISSKQFVCERCRTLETVSLGENTPPPVCGRCKALLRPWNGLIDIRDGSACGDCPRCGGTLSNAGGDGVWD
jgi:hypothetical protein